MKIKNTSLFPWKYMVFNGKMIFILFFGKPHSYLIHTEKYTHEAEKGVWARVNERDKNDSCVQRNTHTHTHI